MCANCCRVIRRNAAVLVPSVLLVIAVTGWVREASRPRSQPEPVEMVEVLVAAKDAAPGLPINTHNVSRFATLKRVPKTELPEKFLSDTRELFGKRLGRTLREGEVIHPDNLIEKGWVIFFPDGKGVACIPHTAKQSAGGHLVPGSKVDILASLQDGEDTKTITLLPDMTILALDGIQESPGKDVFLGSATVSFAVDTQQGFLLTLAEQRNCRIDLLLRHPDSLPRKDWRCQEAVAFLKEWGVKPAP